MPGPRTCPAPPAEDAGRPTYAVVIPTVGRRSLTTLLERLSETGDGTGPAPEEVIVVDDRPAGTEPLSVAWAAPVPLRVVRTGGHGPAAARNAGWRRALAEWIAFLDDDVEPEPGWRARLVEDLRAAGPAAGTQGRVSVPLPLDRRPTDRERCVAGLESARWITADLAYRRSALAAVGGFDEGFRRAYREDADLGIRVSALGPIVSGRRRVLHPVLPAPWWVSVANQRGNADDVRMRRRHGPGWRRQGGVPAGRRPRHVAVTAAGVAAVVAAGLGRRRMAAATGAAWAAGTAELTWARIAPGPRTAYEVGAMVATSIAIPPAAVLWWLEGLRRNVVDGLRGRGGEAFERTVEAVLFDRDGTLVEDVPYNGDPDRVALRPGAADAVRDLRAAGMRIGLISNQSGVGTGRISLGDVEAVNARLEELLGKFDAILVCPHAADAGCACRKPAPLLVELAADRLQTRPERCVMVGDIGSDISAGLAAGARTVLVPTPVTRPEEVTAAPTVAANLGDAVAMILGGAT